ncbi:MAG: tRNA threonylcarbamoyladenosine dehydratase [Clostridiales bacterium]|nr:tRNA threonylcarbamoyladenosine dehydratase [Clostridiales bacterium]
MADWLARTRLLVGEEAVERLARSRVAVLGLGGVGSGAAEGICRSGVGAMLLADCDEVDLTNLNRQLIATTATVGQSKTLAASRRLLDINPALEITCVDEMLRGDNLDFLPKWKPDYVLDAIDNVTAKLALAELCRRESIPLITCLGTGNRLDPSRLVIGDIADTAGCGCPLARVMRRELKKRGVTRQTVLYSTELPLPVSAGELAANGRHPPASMAFVPPAAGLLMASHAVRDLLGLLPSPK